MRRRLVALVCLLASVLVLGGCVAIKSGPLPVQQDVVGDVQVTLTICRSADPAGTPGCPDDGNSDAYLGGTGQVLLAFRVPTGAGAPQSFSSTAGVPLTFTRNDSYRAELDRLVPPPAGQEWVAYASTEAPAIDEPSGSEPAPESTIAVGFGLPSAESPYVGPFTVRAVVGVREVGASLPASRPVDCGPDAYAAWPPYSTSPLVFPEIVCIDSPSPAVVASTVATATRDFGVVGGGATASPGQTVSLPFGVRGAGALLAGLTASLTATTTLPGATVVPNVPTAPLSNGSDTRVTVPVAIPADATAGTYEVALTGRLENGQERRGVAELTVRARPEAPNVAPRLSGLRVKPKAFKPATRRKPKRGTDVSYALSEAASVRVAVERCSKHAKPKGKPKAKRSLADAAARRGRRKPAARRGRCLSFKAMNGTQAKAGKAGANGFRFNGKVAGRALKPGSYRLALTPTDAAGARGATVRAAFAIAR